MSFWTRRKAIDTITAGIDGAHQLKKTLSWPHLVALGVGAIVGTGIYTLTGIGAGLAGPGVILSFLIAGAVCACAALCYAELSTLMPAAGSAYTYSYAAMGEPVAWFVGWSLILEYTLVCAAVSVGWSAHAHDLFKAAGFSELLLNGPHVTLPGGGHGLVNLPAVIISMAVAGLLAIGTRESATVNMILVAVKIVALIIFVALCLPVFDPAHFTPFMPNGFQAHLPAGAGPDAAKVGVMAAASLIFFAFYGFDAVSTAAEETKNPKRDLTIGIVGSMAACTAIYMIVAAASIGASRAEVFSKSEAPLVFILETLKHGKMAQLVALAAVVALPTVILAFMYGQSRIFFVMARDGLLPRALSKVNAKTGTPVLMTLLTGVLSAVLSGFLSLKDIAELANAGTLAAFIAVGASVIVLRLREPDRPRVFSTPIWPVVAPAGILGCLYLFYSLPEKTQRYFLYAHLIGAVIYTAYGMRKSVLAQAEKAPG
ncbi:MULTISPECIES: amino acid permease [Caulobacter]|uniref:Amino acid/polyamine/organocation transporter, APC superfamily n=1 Tax=Caulobacter vibrioides OR37 TaxID=1292034 RepID=R0CWY8_CAUVI|nr:MULTISPECIES: amino acid permease [Caulobacter]ENZ81026.1 amino acid/polyamine/organocation transporter, APC superfamily [Caulobacter vibrioides OR37]MBQ1561023.1 amino acid permease [Caulobacter sp.]